MHELWDQWQRDVQIRVAGASIACYSSSALPYTKYNKYNRSLAFHFVRVFSCLLCGSPPHSHGCGRFPTDKAELIVVVGPKSRALHMFFFHDQCVPILLENFARLLELIISPKKSNKIFGQLLLVCAEEKLIKNVSSGLLFLYSAAAAGGEWKINLLTIERNE